MSLYRKYRPQQFSDVIGQDHILTTLQQACKQQKLTHAYLFSGPRGTGKTSVARILAKEMLIRGIDDKKRQDNIRKNVEDGSLVDLIEIDAASNRGIEDIRDLVQKIQFSPIIAGSKVYIIDEVHMLTKEAFNALLKTLEEPPDYAFFILATTELHKIPLTIQSRCQRFGFRHIRDEDTVRHLQTIADNEHIVIDREALRSIARHVQGSLRDAISILDQLRPLATITANDVRQRIGESGEEYVEDMLSLIQAKDMENIITLVQKMEDLGVPPDSFLRQMLQIIRSSLHEAIKQDKDFVPFHRMISHILDTLKDMRTAPIPGLVLEAALLSWPTLPFSTTVSSSPAPSPIHSPPPFSPPAPSPPPAPIHSVPPLNLASLHTHWSDVIKKVIPPAVRMSLKSGHIAAVQDHVITITFPSAFHRDKIAQTETSRSIEKILEQMFGSSVRLKCILESELHLRATANESVNIAEAAKEVFSA